MIFCNYFLKKRNRQEDAKMQSNNRQRVKNIWKFGKKYIPLFAVAEICILISYTVSVLLPLNHTKLIDRVFYDGEIALLSVIVKNYVYCFLIATLCNFIYAFVWQYLNNHYVLDVKNKLFEKIIWAKASFLSGMNSGEMMTRIDTDADQFFHVIQRNLFHFINSIFMCIGIVVLVARLNLTIAVMIVIAAALPIIITRLFKRFTEKYSKESRELSGQLAGKLYEIIKGSREIKLFQCESFVSTKIFMPLKRLIRLGNNIRLVDFLVNKLVHLVNLATSIIIYSYSVYLVGNWELTIGAFWSIIEYIALLHKKFNWTLRIYLDWFNRKVSIDRVNEVLNLEGELFQKKEITGIDSVEFKNVDFTYDDEQIVLNQFSLKINEGEKVAIVGGSGSGKTTIISLLLGLYEVSNGSILINGIPIAEINRATLRKNIGVVSQDIMIFEGTIRHNLNLGNNYSDEQLCEALEAVGLTQVIAKLANGIDTEIGVASHNLSGGEKQRLMIARLLLKKAKFIILDEATSALDIDTEKDITRYLSVFSKNTTMLIISHRLESIKNCDTIMVLDGQRIVDVGTHEELLKSSPIYTGLFGS